MREKFRSLIGVGVLAAIVLSSWPAVSAGSVAGEPVKAEFNYVGLFLGSYVAEDIDTLVYRPGDGDPIVLSGEYNDTIGNFSVPEADGLQLPQIALDLGLLEVEGKIGLTEDGTGNYDEATGAMSMDLSLAMELRVDDLEVLSNEVGIPLGTGELACEFAPLAVEFSTSNGWPHPGKAFEDKASLKDGAIAGAWRSRPAAVATIGDQAVCNIIGGFLKPVGGFWLANSTETIDEIPWFSGCPVPSLLQSQLPCKGYPPTCTDVEFGSFPDCEEIACPPNMTGVWPNCVIIDPPEVCSVKAVGLTGKSRLRAGKKMKAKLTVKNVGTMACVARVELRSSNRQVKIQRRVVFKVDAGKTATRMVPVRATRRARGKAVISAVYAGKKSVTRLAIRRK